MKATGTDMLLWNAFREGNREAYADIYNLYIEDLLSYGYRVTSNRQLIKDSIQDLFLHLWLHRENLSETDSIKFYLFRSLRNRILRNIEKSDILPQTAEKILENIIEDFSFEQELMAHEAETEQIARLQKAINKLSKRQQEVIQLRYHSDFSLEEIENLMQLNNQSVRNLLHRAISQLRISFEMAGWFFLLITSFAG
ncbi:sigma-70 family RNA polymerase sigma factor [Dyadobacter sp. LHD-138]|uniref:RNA polymerase sigma factor n=1 Tax=Dyadobacter sp. LHD-138 TaxID=3071413 RepID=UPI0027E061BD|nr:sigma-70 family RNA polymerase sigma factor [Dyadobacter sp. LHD-138]MDQ6481749.1 sigma-70 family RNA polymerase sigma factor [Dyadobacter sp. LHD-138]